MLGFIKKDLLMLKSNIKLLVVLFVVYAFMAYKGEMDLTFLIPFMSVMLMISTFSYDNYNKWDAYAITLPNGRRNNVLSKYLSSLILILLTTFITTIASFIISYIREQSIDFEYILMNTCGYVFSIILMASIMYPSIYKFGVENARIGIFVVVFGFAIVGGFLMKYVDFSNIVKMINNIGNYWFVLLPIIMIIMLYISYRISEKIYSKKEF